MQNERIFYMDKAVDLFSSLRGEKVSERIDNAHLGAMGAVNVQVWTSVLGGTLQYETSNGGCTLRVIHTDPVLEGNIPFEQWLSQQTGTIDVECGCVMTEVFFHWLRVAYEAGNSPVIPDGWVACSERMPEEGDDMIVFTDDIVMSGVSYSKKKGFYLQALGYDDDEPVDNVTHWMPLPAAPQQEVKL